MTTPSKAECKRAASLLDDILTEVYAYADRKRLTKKPFAEYDRLHNVWDKYPEEWEGSTLGALASYSVCGSTKNCSAFVRSVSDTLPDNMMKIVRTWRKMPWFWAGFEVVTDVGDSRVEINPIGTPPKSWPSDMEWNGLIVYSPTIHDLVGQGTFVFIALLLPLAGAFHTMGPVIPLKSFNTVDVLAFADFVRCASMGGIQDIAPLAGIKENVNNLSDLIAAQPLSFLRLLEVPSIPTVSGRSGEWRKNASMAEIPESAEPRNPEYWERMISRKEFQIGNSVFLDDSAVLYLQEGSPMYDPSVYIDLDSSRIYLLALHDDAYQLGREALTPIVEFSEKPQASYSPFVEVAATDILDYQDELSLLVTRLSDEDDPSEVHDHEADLALDKTQGILDRLVYNHNEGLHESDDEIAEALDIDPEMVARLRAAVDNIGSGGSAGLSAASFLDLSPREVHALFTNPIPSVNGLISLRGKTELQSQGEILEYSLCDTLIVKFAHWFRDYADKNGRVPATKAGYVKPAMVTAAIESGIFVSPETKAIRASESSKYSEERLAEISEMLRPKKESDFKDFLRCRELLETSGLIRLTGSSFEFAEDFKSLIDDPAGLYVHLLKTAFQLFDWSEYGWLVPLPGIRERGGFLLYAIHKLCGGDRSGNPANYAWTFLRELTQVLLDTYPDSEAPTEPTFGYIDAVVELSFITTFGDMFGLLEYRRDHVESMTQLRPTRLFHQVFATGKIAK